jgi:hypothetical protein
MKFVKKDHMDMQSSAVKFKLRWASLSANIVSEHLLGCVLWISAYLHAHKLCPRACNTAIIKMNSRMQDRNDEEKRYSLFQYVKEIVQTPNIVCLCNMEEKPLYLVC